MTSDTETASDTPRSDQPNASSARPGLTEHLIPACGAVLLVVAAFVLLPYPSPNNSSNLPTVAIQEARFVPELSGEVFQFDQVFWDPRDTVSLRRLIAVERISDGCDVLEIGTGTGLLSLCCLKHGARSVLATDINPRAVANARYNAHHLGVDERLTVRKVHQRRPGAFEVVGHLERFDLILSNPPWEDQTPTNDWEFAFYDERFRLLESILSGLDQHLKPKGRALLAYGCVSAVRELHRRAEAHGLRVRHLDDRDLDSLPELFLPGMLLEVSR